MRYPARRGDPGGPTTAVDGVSFEAHAGHVTALLGPNGAGKTSTVEVLEGYRHAVGGRVRVLGLDPVTEHHVLVRRVGVMLQGGGVYPGIRVREAVALFCAHYGGRTRPDDLLERTGLTELAHRTYRHLSGGEQQRLSLALALAGDPEVLFLDEPTAGVDVSGRLLVRRLVRDLADGGRAVLLTTHDLDEAEKVADHVVIVDRGRVVASGDPHELRASGDRIRFAGPSGIDVAALAAALGAPVHEASSGEYVVEAAPEPQRLAALTAWLAQHDLPLADLRAGRQSLEDVFVRLTTEESAATSAGRRRRSR